MCWMFELGDVCEFVVVWINGYDFGVLWMLLFVLDVFEVVYVGINMFEIVVMNIWCNWLIGDVVKFVVVCKIFVMLKLKFGVEWMLKFDDVLLFVGLFGFVCLVVWFND